MNNVLLLSIQPQYTKMIFEGTKKVELRRSCPRRVKKGDTVIIYASSPVMALVGGFEVDAIIEGKPDSLWKDIKNKAGISLLEYQTYYRGATTAYVISLIHPWEFKEPIPLNILKQRFPGFRPPQSFKYLSDVEFRQITGEK